MINLDLYYKRIATVGSSRNLSKNISVVNNTIVYSKETEGSRVIDAIETVSIVCSGKWLNTEVV